MSTHGNWRFGVYEVDTRRVELRRSGTSIKLREQSFLVLVCLLEHAGEIVTREELRQLLWPSDTFVDFDHSLSTAVMKLREVLGDSTDTPLYIETIPKRGYRFIAPVSLATDSRNGFANPNSDSVSPMTAETSATQSQDEPGGESKGEAQSVARRGRLWMWLLPGGVVLVAGLAGAFWYLHRPLPPLHVTGYTQITHDGHLKILAGTDGARLYFNQVSPLSVAQVAIPGGVIEQIPIAGPDPELVDVSPDGSSLLVGSLPAGVKFALALSNVRILGGSVRRLGEAGTAAFSPGGDFVAFTTAEGDIDLMRSDGSGAHKLASVGGDACSINFGPDCWIAWSPDGKKIRFGGGDKIYEMKADGSGLHEFLAGWRPSSTRCCGQWTPDGKFFLFLSGESVLRGSAALVMEGGEIWALDERRGLFRQPPAAPIQLAGGPIKWGRPIPGKDGRTIFAVGQTHRGELSRFDAQTKQFRPFLGGISAQGVSFSEDGKSVAYVSYPEGILWKANRDGSNPVQLIDPPMEALLPPRWSPDDKQVAFSVGVPDGPITNYVVASEGGSPRKIFPEDNGTQAFPYWSPDGHKLAFNGWADVGG